MPNALPHNGTCHCLVPLSNANVPTMLWKVQEQMDDRIEELLMNQRGGWW